MFQAFSVVVGVTGFEPAASWSRTKRSTELSHTPIVPYHYTKASGICQGFCSKFRRFRRVRVGIFPGFFSERIAFRADSGYNCTVMLKKGGISVRQRLLRWILRILYCAAAVLLLGQVTRLPASSLSPTMYEKCTLPLSRAATSSVRSLICAEAEAVSPPITEPDEPIPVPEEPEPGDIFALMYHDLTEDETATSEWRTTPEGFRADLQELLALGYQPLALEDYVSGSYEIGPDYFIVTFDDGYTSNATLAEPILRELGIPATMFVVTGSTELNNHLKWDELAEMQARGVISVYTHTHTHIDGLQVSTAEFLADVAKSWQEILAHLAEPEHKILSYPNGSHTRATMRALAADGYGLFVVQSMPWWFEAEEGSDADADGIRVLVRMNVAHDADIRELMDLNRDRMGLNSIGEKLEEIRLAAEAALAAERAERQAWMEQCGKNR